MQVFIVLSIILLLFIIISCIKVNYYEGLENKNDKKDNTGYADSLNQIDQCPNPIEADCLMGPVGPAGPSGGTFLQNGVLRNVDKISMVADRFYGNDLTTGAYLSPQNYSTHQMWTLQSDNTLQNKYDGGCLTSDAVDNIYISLPKDCDKSNKWTYSSDGQLYTNKNNIKKCLSYSNVGVVNNIINTGVVNENVIKNKKLNNYDNLLKLNLVECDKLIPSNQKWAFF